MQPRRILTPAIVLALMASIENFGHSAETIQFEKDVRPILSDKCFQCHGPDSNNRAADLRLDLENTTIGHAVVRGSLDESELYHRIVSSEEDEIMPPPETKKALTSDEIAILKRWIEQGAAWQRHWSFESVKPSVVAAEHQDADHLNPHVIDDYIADKLSESGLARNPQADLTTLIRRATFDLTGLPPTLQEVDDFLADSSPDAFERVIDRLLASEHYGERMAIMWLDAARYGDTSVYHADGPRDMWGWRDTVVRSYNNNMPFDKFSIAQLAGDLLPDASLDEKVLSGFNRNNGTTDEGGAFAEEYRVEYAVDRVKTTSTIWLGLTMECAQCHDHKYDPISQEEYYQFFAYFNISADKGMQTRNGNAEPTLAIPDPERQEKLPQVESQLVSANEEQQQLSGSLEEEFAAWTVAQERELANAPDLPLNALADVNLDEGKGKKLSLENGNSKGMISGKAQWVNTPSGKGLRFSGRNFADLGDVGVFERTDSFSYGGWVKPIQGIGALVARMDDSQQHRGYDLLTGVGPISVHIIHDWPENAIKVVTKKKLKANEWYHVFATYDGSSKAEGINVYVNGQRWEWSIEQDRLSKSIRTEKSLLVGSRHPGSRLNAEVDAVQVYDAELTSAQVATLAEQDVTRELLSIAAEDRSESQVEILRTQFLLAESAEYKTLQARIESLKAEISELQKPLTTVMVMNDMTQPRETFVLTRGAYDAPSDRKVEPGTLSVLPRMPENLEPNRLGLARWLFLKENPLTARVTVNRYWQLLFGTGIVNTPEDFGSQGAFPTHPELLNWLAADFREHGWDIKRTLKQMMLTKTYQQSSFVSPQEYASDPQNRLLARGPRLRLQAEFVRDTALALSGLLDPQLGGPGVKPYQPSGLWVEVGLSGKPAFEQDHGEALYRRSLYTYWKRSAPPPSMQIFDAPTREKCTIRRPRTNTPLQALVVLNDPQFVEASRKFGERIQAYSQSDVERVVWGFRAATSRFPVEAELRTLLSMLNSARQEFANENDAAKALLEVGEASREELSTAPEQAAWTILANSLLNLDETLTRE